MYLDDRRTSFVKDGSLFIKPIPTTEWMSEERMKTGVLDLGDACTDARDGGCFKNASASGQYLKPISSAKLTTKNSFSMKYGKVQIRSKLPVGDWLWSGMWLLPTWEHYGTWPASGEIDLMEAVGNGPKEQFCKDNNTKFLSHLHFGPKQHWLVDGE